VAAGAEFENWVLINNNIAIFKNTAEFCVFFFLFVCLLLVILRIELSALRLLQVLNHLSHPFPHPQLYC
jgi:hypothetical protein